MVLGISGLSWKLRCVFDFWLQEPREAADISLSRERLEIMASRRSEFDAKKKAEEAEFTRAEKESEDIYKSEASLKEQGDFFLKQAEDMQLERDKTLKELELQKTRAGDAADLCVQKDLLIQQLRLDLATVQTDKVGF